MKPKFPVSESKLDQDQYRRRKQVVIRGKLWRLKKLSIVIMLPTDGSIISIFDLNNILYPWIKLSEGNLSVDYKWLISLKTCKVDVDYCSKMEQFYHFWSEITGNCCLWIKYSHTSLSKVRSLHNVLRFTLFKICDTQINQSSTFASQNL